MKALIEGLKALGPARQLAMGAVALGMLGLLAVLVMRGGSERMALLYGDLDLRESGQVVERLARQKIPYRVMGQGSEIMVPAEQVAQARLMLAKDGLPSGGSIGYELFDRGDGLAATEFQQKINGYSPGSQRHLTPAGVPRSASSGRRTGWAASPNLVFARLRSRFG